jgi:hypothetical protein
MRKVHRIMNGVRRLSAELGRVNTLILLTMVFLFAVVPLGLLMRISGRSALRGGSRGSSWARRSDPIAWERPF